MAAKPKRIDKEHGFMKIIIKNQVDRDRYNKEVEEERRNHHLPPAKIQLTESASRKPSTSICKPHTREESLAAENIKTKDYIFKLEFVDNMGVVHQMMVSKSENAHSIAQQMASQCNLPHHLIEALEIRLRREFNRKKRKNDK